MILDLLYEKGRDWYLMTDRERVDAQLWWQAVRVKQLVQIGTLDPKSGRVRW